MDYSKKNLAALQLKDAALCLRVRQRLAEGDLSVPEFASVDKDAAIPSGFTHPPLFLLCGWQEGKLLRRALAASPHSRFLVVLASLAEFAHTLATRDVEDLLQHPEVAFLIEENPAFMSQRLNHYFVQKDHHEFLPAIRDIISPDEYSRHQTYYNAFSQALRDGIDMYWRATVGNSIEDQMVGLHQVLTNLMHLPRMARLDPYQNVFCGKPGIVVSSGPSLEKSLQFLREVQSKAVLIAADSCLRKLLQNGIKPFGVSCVERHDLVPQLFSGYEIPNDIVLFTSPLVHPDVIEKYPGPISIVFRKAFPCEWLPPLMPVSNIGMSCSHYSLHLLQLFGCTPIALLGQDLAYDRVSGQSHYQGMFGYSTENEKKRQRIAAEDNQEGLIDSHEWWIVYRNLFEQIIAAMPAGRVENIIESTSGLKIHGARRRDPDEYFRETSARPDLDLSIFDINRGRAALAQDLDLFNQLFAERRLKALDELGMLRSQLASLATIPTPQQYLHAKSAMLKGLSPVNRDFFDQAVKSITRRFDSAARSLWTVSEYLDCRDAQVRSLTETVDTILRELNPS